MPRFLCLPNPNPVQSSIEWVLLGLEAPLSTIRSHEQTTVRAFEVKPCQQSEARVFYSPRRPAVKKYTRDVRGIITVTTPSPGAGSDPAKVATEVFCEQVRTASEV